MSQKPPSIELYGLTALELMDLKKEIKNAGAEPKDVLQSQPIAGGVSDTKYGEPATIIVALAISQIALTGLAIYLAKKRSQNTLDIEIIYRNGKGEEMIHRIRSSARTEEAITADVLEQLKYITVPSGTPDSISSS